MRDKLTLTVPEAGALSGIPARVVRAAVLNGDMPACYAGSTTMRIRRTDLDEAVNFCTLLQKEPVSLNELDVEQTLARLTAKEEQGVTFMDIEQVDRKAERIRGALVGAGLFTAIMLLSIGIMAWAFCVDPQDVPPLPLLVVLFGIPAGCIIGTLKVLVDRLREIGKGEEDAYCNY